MINSNVNNHFVRTALVAAMMIIGLLVFATIIPCANAKAVVVKVGVYQNKPKIYLDDAGNAAGFFPALLNQISNKENWTLNYVSCTWKECLEKLESGEIDLMPDVAYSTERTSRFDFNQEVVLSNWSKVFTTENYSNIGSVMDLDGKRVALVKDSFQLKRLAMDAKSYDIHPIYFEVDSFVRVFEAIEQHKADAGIVNRLVGAQQKDNYDIYSTSIVLFPSRLHFASPKSRNVNLLNTIDRHIAALKRDKHSIYYDALKSLMRPAKRIVHPSIVLSEQEHEWLEQHPVIRVSNEVDWPPFDFVEDGKPRGFSIDYTDIVARKIGVKVEYINGYRWDSLLQKAKKYEIDVMQSIVQTEDRQKYFLFTKPYIQNPGSIYVRRDNTGISRFEDLINKRVAVVEGFYIHEYLRDNYPQIELMKVSNTLEGVKAVSFGKADAYIGRTAVINYVLRNHFIDNVVPVGETGIKFLDDSTLRFSVRKDWPLFATILQKGMSSVSEEEYNQLVDKWLMPITEVASASRLNLSDEESKWLAEHRNMRLAIDPDFAPVEFIDERGEYAGIAAEYVALLNKQLNISIRVVPNLSWSQAINLAKQGDVDVFAAITPSKNRKEFLNFTRPHIKYPAGIITLEDYPFVMGLSDFHDKKVAVVKDYVFQELLSVNFPDIEQIRVKSIADGLNAVSTGRADAFVNDTATTAYHIRKGHIANVKIAAPTEFQPEGFAFGVRKDWPIFAGILNKALDSIPFEEHQRINKKWVDIQVAKFPIYWIWIAMAAAGLMLVFFVTSAVLRIQVRNRTAALSLNNIKLENEIGERKQVEQALIKSEHRLSEFFQATVEMVFFHDRGTILDANPATLKTTGYKPEELLYKNLLEFVAAPAKQDAALRIADPVDDTFESTLVTKSGDLMEVEVHASNFDFGDREVRAVSIRDITDRKNVEKELRKYQFHLEELVKERTAELHDSESLLKENQRRLEFALAAANAGTFYYHVREDNNLWDQSTYDIFGISEDDFDNTYDAWGSRVHPQDWPKVNAVVQDAMASKQRQTFDVEYRTITPIGETRYINTSAWIERDEKGQAIKLSGLVFNITEDKQAEEQLKMAKATTEAANARLRELDRLKSMFIASVSHELRTPLNSIIGFSSMMMRESFGELNNKYKDYASRINNSGEHLLSLITDVIDISKIESGRIDVRVSEFELSQVIELVVSSVRRQIEEKGLQLEVSVPTTKILMHTDERRLTQCMLNLLSNSLKYTEQGQITLSVQQRNDDILVSVQDTGIGIGEADKTRLFEAFERMESHLRVKVGGTGLGLYLTKKIVTELLKGTIGVESRLGEGSTFWLNIPVSIAQKPMKVLEQA